MYVLSHITHDGGEHGNLEFLYGNDETATVTMKRSSFVNGTARYMGGGASIDAMSLSVDECMFRDNTANSGPGGGLLWGGGGLQQRFY